MKQRPLAVVALPLKPPAERPAPRVLLSEADMAASQAKSWLQGASCVRLHVETQISRTQQRFLCTPSDAGSSP